MTRAVVFLVLPLLSAFLAPAGCLVKRRFGNFLNIALYAAGAVLGATLLGGSGQSIVIGGWRPPYGINLYLGPLSAGFGTLIYILAFFLHINDLDKGRAGRYTLLFNLFVFSSLGMIMTGDLFNLFIFVEIGSIALIALSSAVSMKAGTRGALKYLVPSGLLSMIMLASMALLYSSLGTLNMAQIAESGGLRSPLAFLIGLGIIAVFFFEAELFPFNSWVPDVYKGSASSFSAAVAGIGGLAGAAALGRILITVMGSGTSFGAAQESLASVAFLVAGASVLLGEIAALKERDLKKVLGFSSVGQMGIVVLTLAAGRENALFAGLFLLVNHSIAKPLMLLIGGFFVGVTAKSGWGDMTGIGRRYPLLTALFVLGGLSLMGMPLFAGFWGKLVLVRALIGGGAGAAGAPTSGLQAFGPLAYGPWGLIGACIVVFSVVVEGSYLLRIGHSFFERKESGKGAAGLPAGLVAPPKPALGLTLTLIPAVAFALAIVALGLSPGLLSPLLKRMTSDLVGSIDYINNVLFTVSAAGGAL